MEKEYSFFKFTPSVWLVPSLIVLMMWITFYSNSSFNLDLNRFGILPRTAHGLIGIVASPFLHGNLQHIINNTLPIFILGAALVYFYRDLSLKILVYGILLSGLITWIIGRSNYHIGASGLIYVLVSFIFFKGFFTKYYRLVALSFAVVVLYGGMVWYMFPDVDNTISWEGHLAGFITGLAFALYYKTPNYVEELKYDWQQPDFDPMQDPFMKRFDENGNFVNPPKLGEIEVEYEEVVAQPKQQFVYTFIENKNED